MLRTVLYILLALLLLAILYLNWQTYQRVKTVAFVDTAYLFNNFKMKEILETQFNENKKNRQQQLDSLYDQVTSLKNTAAEEGVKRLQRQYLHQRQAALEEQERLKATYDAQIWSQLNSYIKEYGQEKSIDLVLGANGEGTVMHAEEDMNISKQVVDYANKKYNGE